MGSTVNLKGGLFRDATRPKTESRTVYSKRLRKGMCLILDEGRRKKDKRTKYRVTIYRRVATIYGNYHICNLRITNLHLTEVVALSTTEVEYAHGTKEAL